VSRKITVYNIRILCLQLYTSLCWSSTRPIYHTNDKRRSLTWSAVRAAVPIREAFWLGSIRVYSNVVLRKTCNVASGACCDDYNTLCPQKISLAFYSI